MFFHSMMKQNICVETGQDKTTFKILELCCVGFQRPPAHILLTNIGGLVSKFGELQHTLKKSNADVAVATYTKITAAKLTTYESAIPGYSGPLCRDRSEAGGGIAIWITNSLICHCLDKYDSPDHEVLWFTVHTVSCQKLVIGAVCRPVSCAYSDVAILENPDTGLQEVRQKGSSLVLLGDFNVHSEDRLVSSKTT